MNPETIRRLGLAAAAVGFILVVVNAVDYLTGADQISSGVTVIGLVLAVVGAAAARKNR